jgi:polyferredoxin
VRIRDIVTSRLFVRSAFLIFFIWSCVRLWRFARWARGMGDYVPRPEAVAGILPVGHFTSFFAWLKGGGWDTLLPAGLVIIIGAVTVSLVFRRGFCGWICPLGTVWELAASAGRRLMGGSNLRVPRWLDLSGRALRYLIGAAVIAFVGMVSVGEALQFRQLPYMWVADIKILQSFMTPMFILVALFAFVLSMLFGPVWCRWLCPLGALYSTIGLASPCAIHRDEATCTHCGACTDSCHAFVDVERLATVRSPECDGCMDCVRECPVDGCLEARFAGRIRIAPWAWPVLVVGLWLTIYLGAKTTGNWDTTIPDELFRQTINSGLLETETQGFFE